MSDGSWGAHSSLYERVFASKMVQFAQDALVLANLPPKAKCLDVGCGSGAMALLAAQAGHSVVATDFSPKMVQTLHAKLVAMTTEATDRVTTAVVDGQSLQGVDDNSFDVVMSNFGIFLFPDRLAAWKSAMRVLKPNGILVATSWDAGIPPFRAIARLTQLNASANPEAPQPEVKPFNATLNADTFRQEVESCGFDQVEMETIHHELVYASGQQVLEASMDNPFSDQLRNGPQPEASFVFLEEIGGKAIPRSTPLQQSLAYRKPLHHLGTAHVCIARKPAH